MTRLQSISVTHLSPSSRPMAESTQVSLSPSHQVQSKPMSQQNPKSNQVPKRAKMTFSADTIITWATSQPQLLEFRVLEKGSKSLDQALLQMENYRKLWNPKTPITFKMSECKCLESSACVPSPRSKLNHTWIRHIISVSQGLTPSTASLVSP